MVWPIIGLKSLVLGTTLALPRIAASKVLDSASDDREDKQDMRKAPHGEFVTRPKSR
jgi:hypothetical protein